MAALSHPSAGEEGGARLASRVYGPRVPLVVASGGGLVVVVVTTFPHDVSKLVPPVVPASVFSRLRSSVLGCQFVVAPACVVFSTLWRVQGSEWFCVWALDPVETEVHRLVALCSGGGFPELFVVVLFLLLWPVRDW
ncbi:hypothetical protein Taro_002233 [Colocasia esculenta]|uniref:Uncharacterized protein n=1 Tax=Colocasia esculenta TaxID=4460 RepID=A0A843TGP5_COLES|nr:hypothetical protein [Colocasia esculenta]